MSFVTIIDSNESFNLEIGDSTFNLRRLDLETYNGFVKARTKQVWKKHQPSGEETDWDGVYDDMLDYVITGWRNIKHPVTKEDVQCERKIKLKLPGVVREQIFEATNATSVMKEEEKKTKSKS